MESEYRGATITAASKIAKKLIPGGSKSFANDSAYTARKGINNDLNQP